MLFLEVCFDTLDQKLIKTFHERSLKPQLSEISKPKWKYGSKQRFKEANFQISMIKKDETIKAPAFFSKGCLIFKESKHTLVKDKSVYRCSEKHKNNCHKKEEKPLNAVKLEEKIERLMEKFYLPEGVSEKLFDDLLWLWIKSLRKSGQRTLHLENNLSATGNLMIADLKEGKEFQKSDFLEFKRVYFELLKNGFVDFLAGFFIDLLFVLTKVKAEQDDMNSFLKKIFKIEIHKKAQTFSMQIRHVYLSNDGHIENIEFEPFGWFILNYFKNKVVGYEPDVPAGFILNTKKFLSFDYEGVVEELLQNDLVDTYSYNVFATPYAKEKFIKSIFKDFETLSTQQKIDYLISLNNPTQKLMLAQIKTALR